MTAENFQKALGLDIVSMPLPKKEISGAYVGDLLSFVMAKADADNAWVTIMSNINIVAVATLVDIGAIILAEGVALDDEVRETAQRKGVNVFSTPLSAFDIANKIGNIL